MRTIGFWSLKCLQIDQLPSIAFFLLGLFMWLNFSWINFMYVYWPVILLALYLVVQFLPVKIMYHRARLWWAYSNVSYTASLSLTGIPTD